MKYDFSSLIDRHGMDAIAVDSWGEIPGMAPNAPDEGFDRIPMWVADMNFATVPTVQEHIIQRVQHPMFGYFNPRPEYFDRIIEWQSRRNGVEGLRPEHIGYENGVLGGVVSTLRAYVQPGDAVLVSGTLGDHGIAIMSQREGLAFSSTIESDAAPLNHLIADVLAAAPGTRCFRDPTRGGLASTLNEFAQASGVAMEVDENAVPVRPDVQAACEMLGYDVLQVANEGKMVAVVPAEQADAALNAMRAARYGENAAIIGRVLPLAEGSRPAVRVRTGWGSTRILDMLVGEQLPRIC